MRFNFMSRLEQPSGEDLAIEAARLLTELADHIRAAGTLKLGDAIVLRDAKGNRVGVADVFKE